MDRPAGEQDTGKLYLIQYHDYYNIIAGVIDGKQVLIKLSPDGYYFLEFADSGDFVNSKAVHFESASSRDEEVEKLKRTIRRDKPIRVKKFFLEEPHIGIRDLPSNLQEEIEEWDGLDDEEREYYADLIQSWRESEQFTLEWDREYYINKEGKVVSS